jgi:hypothetical protein
MGGYLSGRRGGRPTVESCPTLDLYKLIRQKTFLPDHHCSGSIVWTRVGSGEGVASIGYEASLRGESGQVRLCHKARLTNGEKTDVDDAILIATTVQPFGGVRWWFICPITRDRVSKLHLPDGAFSFASRRAYQLGYRSQRETLRDRASSRTFKLRNRLGGRGGIGCPIPKPKWMRWRTYDRQIERISVAEDIVEAYM